VCIVVFRALPVGFAGLASYRQQAHSQPCNQALNDTANVVLAAGGRNGAAITSSYTLTLFNVFIPLFRHWRAPAPSSGVHVLVTTAGLGDHERIVIPGVSDNGW
jgi:hypothetical protein